jgi:hypothetical protein
MQLGMRDLKGRIARLDGLVRGLAKEVTLWKGGNDTLLYAERRMYMKAIQDAWPARRRRASCWPAW